MTLAMNTAKRESLRRRRRERAREARRQRPPSEVVIEAPCAASDSVSRVRAARPRPERGPRRAPSRPERSTAPLEPGERSWVPLVEAFVATRSFRDPEETTEVMLDVLSRVRSWGDFVSGGFLFLAPMELRWRFRCGAGRTYQLFEGFTKWMHAQREINDWQRDVLLFEIARWRYSYRLRPELPPGVMEMCLSEHDVARLARELTPTLEDPILADEALVASALRCLHSQLILQLGPSLSPPVGSLDPNRLVRDVASFVQHVSDHEHDRALFTTLSRFYDWAGKTGRLDRKRASEIAAVLAMAAAPLGSERMVS